MSDIKFSLISIEGKYADVANNLINKLANGVGWIVNHETPGRVARDTYIKEIQEKNYTPLEKAALISNYKKIKKEYESQFDIVENAIPLIQSQNHIEDVNNEWLDIFMDKIRLVSDEEFKIIWSNILSQECNNPGSISKNTLNILERMDKDTANAFSSICAHSIYINDGEEKRYSPIISNSDFKNDFNDIGINFSNLVELKSLGLIDMQPNEFSQGYSESCENLPICIYYFDKNYTLNDEIKEFETGKVIFTKAGNELCNTLYNANIITKKENFFEKNCMPLWNKDK